MALSVIEHIFHSYRPYDTLLGVDDRGRIEIVPATDSLQAIPGVVIYRFGASVYYANTARFVEECLDIVERADPPLTWFVLDCAAVGDIDYSGSDAIRQVLEELGRKDVKLALSDVNPKVQSELDAYGLTAKIGADRIFDTFQDLLEAHARHGTGATTSTATAAAEPPTSGEATTPGKADGPAGSDGTAAPGTG